MTDVPMECRELAADVEELEQLRRLLQEAVDRRGGGGGTGGGSDGGSGGGSGGGGSGDGPGGGGTGGGKVLLGSERAAELLEDEPSLQDDHDVVEKRLEEVTEELREREQQLETCIESHTDDVPAEAVTAIAERREELKAAGRGLGDPDGPIQRIRHGGSVRHFEQGRIYYHPNTGANEVRGNILRRYLSVGGPDHHPETGRRELKFPTTGEIRSADQRFPVSHFEGGSIYGVRGTGGAAIFGPVHDAWTDRDSERGALGYPITNVHERADGLAAYFQRGCLWASDRDAGGGGGGGGGGGDDGGGVVILDADEGGTDGEESVEAETGVEGETADEDDSATLQNVRSGSVAAFAYQGPPLDGSQTVVDPADSSHTFERAIGVDATGASDDLAEALWADRLALTPSDGDQDAVAAPLRVRSRGEHLSLVLSDVDALETGSAYDVSLRLPDDSRRRLFARAVLAQVDPSTIQSDVRFRGEEMELVGAVDVTASRRDAPTVRLDPAEATVTVGGEEGEGVVELRDSVGRQRLRLDAKTGDLQLGLDGVGTSPVSLIERVQALERRLEELEDE